MECASRSASALGSAGPLALGICKRLGVGCPLVYSISVKDLRRVAIICHVLADYKSDPAVVFLNGKAAQRKWPKRPSEEVARLVEDTFAAAFDDDSAHVVSLCNEDEPLDAEAMRVALNYVEKWRVGEWAAGQNRTKGAAPLTAQCAAEHERRLEVYSDEVRPRSLAAGSANTARKAGSRWRVMWSGAYRMLPPHELPTVEVMQAKVPQGGQLRGCRFNYRGGSRRPARPSVSLPGRAWKSVAGGPAGRLGHSSAAAALATATATCRWPRPRLRLATPPGLLFS